MTPPRWPWSTIRSAPHDGRLVMLAWIVNYPTLELVKVSRWRHGKWEGNWTPTHWRKLNPSELAVAEKHRAQER